MRQFDVLENPNPGSRRHSPYLVVPQSHHLNLLATVFLAPLVQDSRRPLSPLDVEIEFQGARLVIAVGEAAGVPNIGFGRPIGSVAEHEDAIRRAFDRLLTGF